MHEHIEVLKSPYLAGRKTLKDFDTGPYRSSYVVCESSDGYKQYLLGLEKVFQNNIKSHEKRYPNSGTSDDDYTYHQRFLWETKLKEVKTALAIISGDIKSVDVDIIDRLGEENDHLLWLEAITVYSEKINIYQDSLNSPSSNLSEDEKERYRNAIGELSQRIERLELLLDLYANKLRQGLGESAVEKATSPETTQGMASV